MMNFCVKVDFNKYRCINNTHKWGEMQLTKRMNKKSRNSSFSSWKCQMGFALKRGVQQSSKEGQSHPDCFLETSGYLILKRRGFPTLVFSWQWTHYQFHCHEVGCGIPYIYTYIMYTRSEQFQSQKAMI